jgi:hypothetical protein
VSGIDKGQVDELQLVLLLILGLVNQGITIRSSFDGLAIGAIKRKVGGQPITPVHIHRYTTLFETDWTWKSVVYILADLGDSEIIQRSILLHIFCIGLFVC